MTEIGKELAAALATFQANAPDILKDSENPYFKSKYAALDAIIPAIRPAMAKAGLAFIQIPEGTDELRTIIIHSASGQSIEGTLKMAPKDASPQGHGSAITYSRRYALVAMLGLNTEEDDDANAASKPMAGHAPAVAPSSPPASVPPAQAPKPGCITVPQAKRAIAIAKGANKTDEQIKESITKFGVSKLLEISREDYERLCTDLQTKSERVDESVYDESEPQ